MPAATRKMHCTRKAVASVSHHRSNGLVGLRLIDNNYVSNGTGRDWVIFGDPGYEGGRRTPVGLSSGLPPQGDRDPLVGPPRKPKGDGRRPIPAVPRGKDGSALKPLPSVVQRWQRVASAPSALDAMARTGDRSAEPRDALPLATYLSADEQAKLDSQFKPNMACHPFSMPTFPVEKYNFFSHQPVLEAKRPKIEMKLGPHRSTYSEAVVQKLENPVIASHHFFAEDTLRDSAHFVRRDTAEPLSKTRRRAATLTAMELASVGEGSYLPGL
eukprot:TRINITY_DN21990_c0_g1_i3.p1 TRINITY_DN21990_c0_g1~~TRINITY_DN21990_c0_g1_i3.p1  ORF type:complete len:304 (+),score=32.61 TRINITY_DN21990_c0_g1_i3:101-913(+)